MMHWRSGLSLMIAFSFSAPAEVVTNFAALWNRQFPRVVSVSPDLTKVIEKSVNGARYELNIVDISAGESIVRSASDNSQLSLTWSPQSDRVLFQQDQLGNRQFRIGVLTLGSPEAQWPSLPISQSAKPPLRWSPDGQRFAYLQVEGARAHLIQVGWVKGSAKVISTTSDIDPEAEFSWRADGKTLLAASASKPGTLVEVDGSGKVKQSFLVQEDTRLRDFDISPDGKSLLVTGRSSADEYFGLWRYPLNHSPAKAIPTGKGDVFRPRWFGKGYAYELRSAGQSRIYSVRAPGSAARLVANGEGWSELQNVRVPGKMALLYTSLTAPSALQTVDLKTAKVTALFGSAPAEGVRPETIALTAADGTVVPAFHWKALAATRSAIVKVHGGPHLADGPAWDAMTQSLVASGFDVISVNFKGSTGYGQRYESAGDEASRVRDCLAALSYVNGDLQIPEGRTYFLGSSYGSFLLVSALGNLPPTLGGVVLTSVPGVPTSQTVLSHAPPVFVFQGQQDEIWAPTTARRALEFRLGKLTFNSKRWGFHTLTHEGHAFRSSEAWIRIGELLLQLDHLAGTPVPEENS
jgi:dipeptidyl aminopeptidase/acylaminoacyl peptidase